MLWYVSASSPQRTGSNILCLLQVYETGTAITSSGALTAYSGTKTGRSPLDKRIVQEPSSEKDIWWGPVNKPMSPDVRRFPIFLFF
jgi:ATP-dependent phosphoenolpyruvate carboxykinase